MLARASAARTARSGGQRKPAPPSTASTQAPTEDTARVPTDSPAPVVRRHDLPARLASGPERESSSASLPYPVIVLAVLAGVLLLTGGVGWVTARRR